MKINFSLIVYSAFAVCLASCSQNAKDQSLVPTSKATQPEEAYPNQRGITKTGFLNGEKITYRLINDQPVFESDILLSSESIQDQASISTQDTEGTGRSKTTARWPNKIVYYTISSSLPNQQRVLDAIAHWEANTPIRFVARTTQRGYVIFQPGSGCAANVGYSGSVQYVNLASSCTTGSTIHEIGHVVGLWHEHTRADRDTYVTINTSNIISGYESDFQTYVQRGLDGFDYPGGLDFNSIMLYGSYDFSQNGLPTITKKDGSTFTSQRDGLSPIDISTVQYMYP